MVLVYVGVMVAVGVSLPFWRMLIWDCGGNTFHHRESSVSGNTFPACRPKTCERWACRASRLPDSFLRFLLCPCTSNSSVSPS